MSRFNRPVVESLSLYIYENTRGAVFCRGGGANGPNIQFILA